MHERETRLAWIERLIGETRDFDEHRRAIVVEAGFDDLAIPFESIAEVVPGSDMRSFPFLPPEYCGVIDLGTALVPVLDAGGTGRNVHVALLSGNSLDLGLRFAGTPHVVVLDESNDGGLEDSSLPYPFIAQAASAEGRTVHLLDVSATVDALTAAD